VDCFGTLSKRLVKSIAKSACTPRSARQARTSAKGARIAKTPTNVKLAPWGRPISPNILKTGRPGVEPLEIPERSGVEHTAELEGGRPGRPQTYEFVFNLRLPRRDRGEMKAAGFARQVAF